MRQRWLCVPWDAALYLHSRLAERGLPSTLTFLVWERQARLDFWPGADTDWVIREAIRIDQLLREFADLKASLRTSDRKR